MVNATSQFNAFHFVIGFWVLAFLPGTVCPEEPPPPTASARYTIGLGYERLGRLEPAYTELQLASALEPDNPRIALALGLVATRLGHLDVAQRVLEQSILSDAHSIASYYQLAYIYEKQQAVERAIDAWKRFLELTRDDVLRVEAKKHIYYLESRQPVKTP